MSHDILASPCYQMLICVFKVKQMNERETHHPKWNQSPLGGRWGRSLEDTSLTAASQSDFYFGDFSLRGQGGREGGGSVFKLPGFKGVFISTSTSQPVDMYATDVSAVWKCWAKNGKSAKLCFFFFWTVAEVKIKEEKGSAGEAWLEAAAAAAEWTSNGPTPAYLHLSDVLLDINVSPFIEKTAMHFSAAHWSFSVPYFNVIINGRFTTGAPTQSGKQALRLTSGVISELPSSTKYMLITDMPLCAPDIFPFTVALG